MKRRKPTYRALAALLAFCLPAIALPISHADTVGVELFDEDAFDDAIVIQELDDEYSIMELPEDVADLRPEDLELPSPAEEPDQALCPDDAEGRIRYARLLRDASVYAEMGDANALMTLPEDACVLVTGNSESALQVAFATADGMVTGCVSPDDVALLSSDEIAALMDELAACGPVMLYEDDLDRPLPNVEPLDASADAESREGVPADGDMNPDAEPTVSDGQETKDDDTLTLKGDQDPEETGKDPATSQEGSDAEGEGESEVQADADDSQDDGNDDRSDGQMSGEASTGDDGSPEAQSEDDISIELQEGDAESEDDALIADAIETSVDELTLVDEPITADASGESLLVDEEEGFCTLDPSRDSDELFAAYAQRFFQGGNRLSKTRASAYCRESLSDQCMIMYDAIKPEILKVAEGSRSSTIFPVLLSQILGKTRFYAKADLNLDIDPPAEGAGISSEVKTQLANAYNNLYDDSLKTIVNTISQALWLDCTYELYWLDRYDRGVSISRSGAYVKYDSDAGDYVVYVADDAGITFKFPVLESYALVEDGVVNIYEVDTSLIDSAKQAGANARAIVRKYEDYPDYVKLYAYAKEICDLVDYDYTASDDEWADSNPQVQDPWKLIWVFDDDPDTKVVCEGYAQAYKYLCELSSFSGNVGCWHVTGDVPGGAHSWNIVRMEDGKNYVVDVTWMDGDWDGADGTIADWINDERGQLFLCGASSGSVSDDYCIDYRNGDYQTTRSYMSATLKAYPASALTLAGSKYILTGWQAIDGYAYYFDENGKYLKGTQEIDGYSYIFDDIGRLIKSHVGGWQTINGKEFYFEGDGSLHTDHTSVTDLAVDVTETADGLTEGSHCSVCGAVIVAQQAVHRWNDPTYTWASSYSTSTAKRVCANDASHVETRTVKATAAVALAATCTEKGKTTYTAVFPNAAFETQTRTVEDIPAKGHSWGSPTYTWAGDNSSVTAKRLCTIDGCNGEETETVNTASVVSLSPTCFAKGKTTYTATFDNPAFETQSQTVEDIPIDTAAHDWGAVSYDWAADNKTVTAKRICANDASHVETETVNTTAAVALSPTCTAKGKTTYTATFKNAAFETQSKTLEDIPAKGHTAVTDPATAATCTAAGKTEGSHCSVCKAVLVAQEAVPATGHSWGAVSYTWSSDNKTVTAKRICANDASHVETETASATSTVSLAPTCTAMGKTTYTATFKNGAFAKQTRTVEDIPAKGHTAVTDKAVAATCTAAGKTEGSHCSVCKAVLVAQETVPATGHSWGAVSYTWSSDNRTVTARRVCKNDAGHVEAETMSATAAVSQAATCTEKGKTTYTSGAFTNTAFKEQAKTVADIPATGHTPVTDKAVAATSKKAGLTKGSHCSVCGTVLKAQKIAPYKISMKKSVTKTVTVGVPVRIVYAGKTIKSCKLKKTSYKKLATVTGSDLVTPKKKGTVKITVTPKKGKAITLTLKIVPPEPTGIVITSGKNGKATVKKGKKLTLKTKLTPGNAESTLTWKSSNKKVATVSGKGVVKGVKKGTCTITVTTGNRKKATVKITVK